MGSRRFSFPSTEEFRGESTTKDFTEWQLLKSAWWM